MHSCIIVCRWTLPYLSKEVNKALRNVLYLLEHQGMVDIEYRKYDWTINKAESKRDVPPSAGATGESTS